ncbi:MAG: glycerol acyltransferase [Deltaproteobacteria bacterium]|nr:glycerol acyltransferase [Deltaproteobacteria bacterium]
MQYTIFDTPILRTVLHWIGLLLMKMLGWRTEGDPPDFPKYVLIAAPHTSNWDFFYTMLLAFIYRLNVYFMAKKELFRWPFGYGSKWLGMIPIDRSKAGNVVAQTIQAFEENERLIMVVPPSGTRKKVMAWKTGFYHIANGAKVPIVMGFVDYRRKTGGFGPSIMPTGDIDADMAVIKDFYKNVTGKNPEQMSGKI